MKEELFVGIKITLAVAGGAIAAWFGRVWPMVVLVLVFMAFDYITGMLAAGINGKLESEKGYRGLLKKGVIMLMLGLGLALDAAIPWLMSHGLNLEIGINLPFGVIVCAWIIINESISVVENFSECGVKVPGFLMKILKITAEKIDSGDTGGGTSD